MFLTRLLSLPVALISGTNDGGARSLDNPCGVVYNDAVLCGEKLECSVRSGNVFADRDVLCTDFCRLSAVTERLFNSFDTQLVKHLARK